MESNTKSIILAVTRQIPQKYLFITIFATVWLSILLQKPVIYGLSALYVGLVTSHFVNYATFVPSKNGMLQMATMMLGPKVTAFANIAFFLYRKVIQKF